MHFDPYDPDLHRDPYPVYRRLRDEFPLHYAAERDFYSLSRYEDVHAALLDPGTFCSGRGVAVGVPEGPDGAVGGPGFIPLLIMMDGRRHTRLRGLVSRAFTPRRIAELEPRVRAVARRLLEEMCRKPEADLVSEFSGPLPTIVIAELLGIPAEDQAWFKEKSNAVAQFDPANARAVHPSHAMGAGAELAAYLGERFEERRHEPRDDLLSALLAAEIDEERLSQEELLGFAFLLLVAGNETTTNLISNATILLDRHREVRAKLSADPGLLPRAMEEFLRFDPPVQGLARTTTRPVSLHGVDIPEGKKVLLLFAAANRDERKFSDPERFDVTRDPNPHLSFGFGAHFCLGANLARLEARVAFEELLPAIPDYRLLDQEVERLCSGPIRGVVRLPIATGH